MGRLKEWILLACLTTVLAATIESSKSAKEARSQRDPLSDESQDERVSSHGRENFNPGYTQHGGWHEPEETHGLQSRIGGNQWQAGDFSNYNPNIDSKNNGYQPEPISVSLGAKSSYPIADSSQYSGVSSSSLNQGGDLIVGQGSVQRPANVGYSQESYSSKGAGSYPVQAGGQNYAQGGPRYSQPAPSASKKQEYPSYSGQAAGNSGGYRQGSDKPAVGASQYAAQKPAYSPQDGKNVHQGAGGPYSTLHSNAAPNKFPSYNSASRPVVNQGPKVNPAYNRPSLGEGPFQQGGARYPGPGGFYGAGGGPRSPAKRPLVGPKFPGGPSHAAAVGLLQSEPGGPYYSVKSDNQGGSFFPGL